MTRMHDRWARVAKLALGAFAIAFVVGIEVRWARFANLALGAFAIAFVVTHIIAVFKENVNWDEFALLQRGERTFATGQLFGGGRPGLGTLAVMPFAYGCRASMDAIHAARLAWLVPTIGILAGIFAFVLRATRRQPDAWQSGVLATALLALVPVFMKYSVQVRTDQPAVVAAIWGGVALFASANRARWAFVAGALFAIGYLFSQKAVYITALVAIVVAGDAFIEGRIEWRRELVRVCGTCAGAILAIVGYRFVVPLFYATPNTVTVSSGLDLFDFYRRALGYRVYWEILPTLVPHMILLGCLIVATVRASRHRSAHVRPLLVALGVAAAGLAVGRFHAAAFPYFWITLGVFFAIAAALGWPGICATFPRVRVPLFLVVSGWLVVNAVRVTTSMLEDSQAVQRDTLGFVDRNFDKSFRSYDTHGAMFCRADPDPIAGSMVSSLMAKFSGPESARATHDFIEDFRARPIAILMPNQLEFYPRAIKEFWDNNYQRYYGPVRIAGRKIDGKAGTRFEYDVFVPGRYRWRTRDGQPSRLVIDGRPVAPTIELVKGAHAVELLDDASGLLVLDVPEPPWLGQTPFYSTRDDQRWHEQHDKVPVFR
jgi:hypothetical protein